MKVVLITGAGRGLGRAIANIYHKNGFEVIATDVNNDLLLDIDEKKKITVFKLDITSEKNVEAVAEAVGQKYGRLDVLVSNAGIFDFYPISEAGADKLKSIFDVNVFGLANLAKYFLPFLIKSKGRLIVISSESYKAPSPFQPYSVSKQTLERLFDGIRLELMTKGIKTVLIRPGAMQTQILEKTLKFNNSDYNGVYKNEFNFFLKSVNTYIGKIAPPDKVAWITYKAGTRKNPKRVYNINHNPLVSLLSILPKKMIDNVVFKSLTKG